MSSPADPATTDGPGLRQPRLKRTGLAIAAALVSINIWTGAPLLAVWIGSRVAPSGSSSMTAIFVVLVVLVVSVLLLASALARINGAYDRLRGRQAERRTTPWLRSARDERHQLSRQRLQMSVVERTTVASVVFAVLAFEVWFFFFARYSIPGA